MGRGRCDAMLTSDELLYLAELKDRGSSSWRADAIEQLKSTIEFLRQHHDLTPFRHKKAFACNKKRQSFQQIDHEERLRFFRTYGFRLDLQATIKLPE